MNDNNQVAARVARHDGNTTVIELRVPDALAGQLSEPYDDAEAACREDDWHAAGHAVADAVRAALAKH